MKRFFKKEVPHTLLVTHFQIMENHMRKCIKTCKNIGLAKVGIGLEEVSGMRYKVKIRMLFLKTHL